LVSESCVPVTQSTLLHCLLPVMIALAAVAHNAIPARIWSSFMVVARAGESVQCGDFELLSVGVMKEYSQRWSA